ncbi:MAG TPA: hypothetical protein VGG53_22020 [Mycobacterium sp.]|jgi:hypothetical protein|uniref:hypothetical protein n=1 Tax=Mycobacterium sp. TaxID=1785 RepID=UPI002F419358
MSAREDVLRWGLVDWVELDRIHWFVAREYPEQPLAVVQNKTLELIRSLASEGLFDVGDLASEDRCFRAWDLPLGESIQRIADTWPTLRTRTGGPGFVGWISQKRASRSPRPSRAARRQVPTLEERMMSAHDEVLLRGLIDWVALERVHWIVARENADDSLPVIQ